MSAVEKADVFLCGAAGSERPKTELKRLLIVGGWELPAEPPKGERCCGAVGLIVGPFPAELAGQSNRLDVGLTA